jgi:hypothetical protein
MKRPIYVRPLSDAELSWVLEDNKAINHAFEVGGAKLYKSYRIYQKEIG